MKVDDQHNQSSLPDMQNSRDERNIAIDRVGVRNVAYPIVVMDRADKSQHSVGTFTLTVDLPHHFKGTHMSRFVEVLNEHRKEVSVHGLPGILSHLRERLQAEESHLEVRFPFFISKMAPVSGQESMMPYDCGFRATQNSRETTIELLLTVPITTLCPCSKEISAYGAHNQRGYVSVTVSTTEHVWLEEIIEMIESAASSQLYPLLKRPDEKFVTEQAYDNPRFVEDMVREVALRFEADTRISGYEIEVENHESIHAHNAYAQLSRTKL